MKAMASEKIAMTKSTHDPVRAIDKNCVAIKPCARIMAMIKARIKNTKPGEDFFETKNQYVEEPKLWNMFSGIAPFMALSIHPPS